MVAKLIIDNENFNVTARFPERLITFHIRNGSQTTHYITQVEMSISLSNTTSKYTILFIVHCATRMHLVLSRMNYVSMSIFSERGTCISSLITIEHQVSSHILALKISVILEEINSSLFCIRMKHDIIFSPTNFIIIYIFILRLIYFFKKILYQYTTYLRCFNYHM